MRFNVLANLFEELENNSKRLKKILILRDFYFKYEKESPLIFDLISSNYYREIDKRSIGISIKTIFSVMGFISQKSQRDVEIYFNKIGDIGEVAKHFLEKNKQKSLSNKILNFEDIINSLKNISQISGINKNKNKKEILTNLFLSCESKLEYKFLARLLIDDLRIGVSVGVLREAVVNSIFPKIIGINLICNRCNYPNLNVKNCVKCDEKLDEKNQKELVNKKYKICEIDTPEEFIGLDEFIGKSDKEDKLKFILRLNKCEHIIKSNSPRNLYNLFLSLFEKKYNILNSFRIIIKEMKGDLTKIIKCEIILGKPIKSMLGTRTNKVEDSFEVSEKPALIDYKYDGLRVQIHNNYGKVNLFSRNLDDITKQFPEIVEFVKNNFSDINFVIDSECVGYDFKKMEFLPFQILSRRILSKNINEVNHIKVIVKAFDLLYLNNETLIDENYKKRRNMLEKIFLNRDLIQEMNFDLEKIKNL